MEQFNIDEEVVIGVTPIKQKKGAGKKKLAPKKKTKNNNKKKKKINNKKLNRIIKCTSFIVLGIVLLIFLMVSPIFNIENIEIEGNSILSNEKIISLSEIRIDENIFRINKISVKEKIKSNAYVESVEISRKLPNTIQIKIKERKVKYMLEYADGYVYVNSQGYMIDISKDKKEVPIIIGYSTENTDIAIGNRLKNEDLKGIEMANKIVEVANSNEITSLITKIDISNSKNYTLILETEGKKIYLGDCSDLTTRIARAKAIIEKTEGKEGEIFLDGNTSTENPRFKENVF